MGSGVLVEMKRDKTNMSTSLNEEGRVLNWAEPIAEGAEESEIRNDESMSSTTSSGLVC